MALPVITPEQRRELLEKARAARVERTQALAPVKDGRVTLAAVLADEDSPLQKAKVRQVLLAVPGIGRVRAEKIMRDIGITDNRRVGGLSPRQRRELAALPS
jgi:hypothetical protein